MFTSLVLSLLTGRHILDSQCGFRAYSARLLATAPCRFSQFEMESEIIMRACNRGFSVDFVSVQTLYFSAPSHISPITDTLRWLRAVITIFLELRRQQTGTMYTLKPKIANERLIKKLREKGISDKYVLDAFRKVSRHLFIDKTLYAQAYDNNALPIGGGQTISQPYVVALMTQILQLGRDQKILEIGTGSGFQTAILAQFSRRVYTIERNRDLGALALKRLRDMGYENIVFKVGDGTRGWVQHAPFDRIIVTAGAPVVPQELIDQMAMGGRMIIPTGDRSVQELELYEKQIYGINKSIAGSVVFVPLIGEKGWSDPDKR